jgi:hypothetical protein
MAKLMSLKLILYTKEEIAMDVQNRTNGARSGEVFIYKEGLEDEIVGLYIYLSLIKYYG